MFGLSQQDRALLERLTVAVEALVGQEAREDRQRIERELVHLCQLFNPHNPPDQAPAAVLVAIGRLIDALNRNTDSARALVDSQTKLRHRLESVDVSLLELFELAKQRMDWEPPENVRRLRKLVGSTVQDGLSP